MSLVWCLTIAGANAAGASIKMPPRDLVGYVRFRNCLSVSPSGLALSTVRRYGTLGSTDAHPVAISVDRVAVADLDSVQLQKVGTPFCLQGGLKERRTGIPGLN